ncbi:transglycosylase SLT domain-containing protein [Qipengyuania sp. ASV99]|uniref:transglycosylase SLT domain-containing protein n=1 Tax=Qipengyuania sp. ASV99 TaxID=3399681 RepID=UPI003A4C5D75
MTQPSIPSAGMRAAFDRAAQVHAAASRAPRSAAPDPPAAPAQRLNAAYPVTRSRTPGDVEQAIASAAQQTGVDFGFLIAQAQVESAMNPDARARTSSATGLYQFVDSTWLGTMQRHGGRFGLGDVAAQIALTPGGTAQVTDPAARAEILALRSDPQIASLMAAGLAEDNRAYLTPILGREPDHSELYLAHFLGAGGAGRFLSAMSDNPNQSAASLFSRPAAANRPVFYESDGSPRSLAGVMHYLSAKLERARGDAPASFPGAIASPYSAAATYSNGFASLPSQTRLPAAASLADNAQAGSRGTMAGLLENIFAAGISGASSDRSAQHIQRAYHQFKAFGL